MLNKCIFNENIKKEILNYNYQNEYKKKIEKFLIIRKILIF